VVSADLILKNIEFKMAKILAKNKYVIIRRFLLLFTGYDEQDWHKCLNLLLTFITFDSAKEKKHNDNDLS
jgi:hypothetical protein